MTNLKLVEILKHQENQFVQFFQRMVINHDLLGSCAVGAGDVGFGVFFIE